MLNHCVRHNILATRILSCKKKKIRTPAAMPMGKIEAFDETSDDWNAFV